MNIYQHKFACFCPSNGQQIIYTLKIESQETILVENITAACARNECAYQEQLADFLLKRLGGKQTITAHHHGVDVVTIREEP